MIDLHRLGNPGQGFKVNPDLILTIEAHPDTVVSLVGGIRIVVSETPDEVTEAVRDWRVSILSQAMRGRGAVRARDAVRITRPHGAYPAPVEDAPRAADDRERP